MKNHILAAAVALLAAGCAGLPESETLRLISVPVASGAIVPDGIDSEEAWSSAVAVPLLVPADRPGSLEPLDWGSLGEEQDVLLLCVNDLAVFQGDLHPACLAEQKGEGGGKDLLPPGGRGDSLHLPHPEAGQGVGPGDVRHGKLRHGMTSFDISES